MLRTRLVSVIAVSVVVVVAVTASTTHVSAAGSRGQPCATGRVVADSIHAPKSVPAGQSFTVDVNVLNCTAASQAVTLEGRLVAPSPCFAPVLDPLAVNLQPHQRFTLTIDLQGTQCTGKYIVTSKVVQRSTVLAQRSVKIRIT